MPPSRTRATALGVLLAGACGLALPALAQITYSNYTFFTFAGQSPGWFDGTNTGARFYVPFGAATDAGSNVYVADTYNHLIRKITPAGVVTTLAGLAGCSGTNDGTGQAARFDYPGGVAVDAGGNVYVADTYNHAIRKISPAGVVTTLAGLAGTAGTNNGTVSAALFNYPYSLTVDTNGNLYVADTANNVIRLVTPAGQVTTFAGQMGVAGTNDGNATNVAQFNLPYGVAVDTNGNLYVADTYNYTIRKITANTVSTLAGQPGTSGNNDAKGTNAHFAYPCGVASTPGGTLYVADTGNSTVREVTSAGQVTTLAGTADSPGSANGTGSSARFYEPLGLAVDRGGNVYVADTYNSMIRKMTPSKVVTTLAGVAAVYDGGSADGTGGTAQFKDPYGAAVNSAGTIYVTDTANDTIREITPAGVVTTFAGQVGVAGSANGSGTSATFNNPGGLAVDTNGNLYVADTYNHIIRKISKTGAVKTLAGTAGQSGSTNATGTAARFFFPVGVAVDANTNVYVADTGNSIIRKINSAGVVTTFAGVTGTNGATDGPVTNATFNGPEGVAVDANGNVYVADTGNSTIRKISSGVVSTIAGRPGATGAADGAGTNALFDSPYSLVVDTNGILYVADTKNSVIRRIMPDGTVTTLAGEVGLVGTSDGTGPDALFNTPEGLALDPSGNLYVADTYNCTIRKGNPALPDAPVVDTPFAPAETIRHFNITNFTAKNWTWSIVRHPSTSTNAALSSATAQNPTLTPDVNDLFVVRFYGTNSQGQVTMGTLAIANDLTPPSVQITMPDPGQEVQSSPFYIYGTASDDVEVAAVWYQLNGGPWAQAVGTLTWVDQISSTLQGQNTLSVYAVDGSGKFSATNSVVFTYGVEAKVTPGAGGLGFLTNQFGFHITGTSNLSVVVQASANLASGQWTPVSTNVLSGGATYFSDPQWTNYPARYYRLVWQ